MSSKGAHTALPTDWRVQSILPDKSKGHDFEPRCWISAIDPEMGDCRFFDVPDADEGQRAVAAGVVAILNSHEKLLAAARAALQTIQCLRDNDDDEYKVEVQLRAAIAAAEK